MHLKLEKCTFLAEKVKYLRMMVGKGRVQMGPVKLKAIQEWSPPKPSKLYSPFSALATSIGSSSLSSLILLASF